MSFDKAHPSTTPGGWFPPTRWSLVLSSQHDNAAALDALCRMYWRPVLAYVGAQGWTAEDAKDLTQEYFSKLLSDGTLRAVAPEKGKLRTLLLVILQRFLVNARKHDNAQKRGGGWARIEGDTAGGDALALPSAGAAPDRVFDQSWALTLLDSVVERLHAEYSRAGKDDVFDVLRPVLTVESCDLRAAAQSLRMTEGAVRVAAHRLRRRCRDLFTEEIARTVGDDSLVEDEMRALLEAFA
jgi:DNA-directed RNA polymerase specialized sigma24 family protein